MKKARCLQNLLKVSLILLFSSANVFFSGCSSNTSHDGETTLVFKKVTVIDAVNGVRANQNVVIRGNKIIEVGPEAEIKVPSRARVIDCNQKYMIPGLWDAHLHLTNNKNIAPVIYQLFLVNGITYIRDTAGNLDLLMPLVEESLKMTGIAPRVFITGPHLDGLPLSWSSSVGTTSIERARRVLDSLIDSGVDHIKVYELIAPEIYADVLSRARSRGYKVSGHIPLTMDAIEAANAGLSSVEHLNNLELSMSSDWDSLLRERQKIIANTAGKTGNEVRNQIYSAQRLHAFRTQDTERREKVINSLAVNNTWQVPTLVCLDALRVGIYKRENYRNTFKYLPEPVRSDWEKNAIEMMNKALPEVEVEHAGWANDLVPELVEAGVGIMAGTDSPLFMLTPGYSLHEELVLLVNAGLTPMQAIESATLRPAQFFGLEKQQGSIGKGMLADLVILDANPLENIANTQSIRAVVRDGHFHSRGDLDKILNQLENTR